MRDQFEERLAELEAMVLVVKTVTEHLERNDPDVARAMPAIHHLLTLGVRSWHAGYRETSDRAIAVRDDLAPDDLQDCLAISDAIGVRYRAFVAGAEQLVQTMKARAYPWGSPILN